MKIPVSWIKEYIDYNISNEKIAELLTMAGTEVSEIIKFGSEWDSNITIGKIKKIDKHPNADRLSLVEVDNSQNIVEVVCGAPNIQINQKIALAQPGAKLYNPYEKKISVLKKSKIRGIESSGMICSPLELKYSEDHEGILVLDENEEIGASLFSVIGDEILDFDITPNRADCLSVIGITREIIAILSTHKYDYKINEKYVDFNTLYNSFQSKESKNIEVVNSNYEKCLRYSGAEISSIDVGNSPFWIKDRLIKSGLRPINNIVDITNYVMLELGQPLHAFDLSKITTKKIDVKSSKNKEKFKSLDGENRELNSNMLSITDGTQSIGLAGIMGGFNSEIDSKTKRIFLESACFEMSNIRQTSKELGLNTDASHRFERGVPIELSIIALNRAIELIKNINNEYIVIDGKWDLSSKEINKNSNKKLKFTSKRYRKIIGENIKFQKSANIFNSLGFKTSGSQGKHRYFSQKVEIPYWRSDITIEDDLIEEIARIIGYDNLSSTPMQYPENNVPIDNDIQARNDLHSEMKSLGYLEVINYPVLNDMQYNSTTKDNSADPIELQNPTNQKNKFMRPNLRAGLIDNLSKNAKKYPEIESWKFYELGRTYISEINPKFKLPVQNYALGIITSGNYENKNWTNDPSKLNFYTLKGHVERLLHALKIEFNFSQNEDTEFYTNQSANIISNNITVGSIGFINEKKLIELNSKIKDVLYAELNLDNLLNNQNQIKQYQKTSAYPQAIRDISLRVDKNIWSDQISDIIKQNPLVTDLNVIDVYNDLEPGKKSITFRITYQSFNETLNNEKIDESQNKILNKLKKQLNIELRKI